MATKQPTEAAAEEKKATTRKRRERKNIVNGVAHVIFFTRRDSTRCENKIVLSRSLFQADSK